MTIHQFVGAVALWASASAQAAVPAGFDAVPLDIEKTDLTPLIEAAAANPNQFAVDIPRAASPGKSGAWSVENGNAVWRYAVMVPGAVSMSFHAINVKLPDGAAVALSNGTDSFPITAKSLTKQGDLWSRVSKGAVAYVSASMPAEQRKNFSLAIVSVQAGFKGFGGVGNAKTYETYAARAATSSCQVNFSCVKDSSNALPSRAVVGLLIANTGFCTGTLLNDAAGDYKPYVLTARHCGSASNINWDASTITVAWNAVADCGQPLQYVYNSSTVTSVGAITRMISGADSKGNTSSAGHTGDAWLIELDSAPPVGSHPYWAGFDATDSVPTAGVYNINHGSKLQQQYAASTNAPSKFTFGAGNVPTTYDNGYWDVLPTTSATQPGASGSGLIDAATNRVIGSLTGGVNPNNCPGDANPPTDVFYRLAISWVGDGTSSGSIKPWLDPASTGTLSKDGQIGPPAVEVIAPSSATAGQVFPVSWNSSDATSCLASGGTAGDGWPVGMVGASGAAPVTESVEGLVSYTVTCTNSSGHASGSTSVMVSAPSTGGGTGGSPPGSSGSGGSGGGAFSVLTLLPMLLLGLWRRSSSVKNSRSASHAN